MEDKRAIIIILVLCVAWQTHAAVNCTQSGAGRHADTEDTTCKNYTLCVYDSSTDSYLSYTYVCSRNSVFNPTTSKCTASGNYVCNVTTTTTTTSTTTETPTTTTTENTTTTETPTTTTTENTTTTTENTATTTDNTATTTENTTTTTENTTTTTTENTTTTTTEDTATTTENTTTTTENTATTTETSTSSSTNTTSDCTEDGYIADPNSTNCSAYIECVEISGTFSETIYTCPDNTYFDPNTTLCDSDYNCTITDDTAFNCTANGRFANTVDTTCQTYYFCVLAKNGTYLQYEYTCPSTSVFSPTSSVCTTSYTCTTS